MHCTRGEGNGLTNKSDLPLNAIKKSIVAEALLRQMKEFTERVFYINLLSMQTAAANIHKMKWL